MSTRAQIPQNLIHIASGAQSTNFGTIQQASQIIEAIDYIYRLWGEANMIEALPIAGRVDVIGWLSGIAGQCKNSAYFQPNDQGHLQRAAQYILNLRALVDGACKATE